MSGGHVALVLAAAALALLATTAGGVAETTSLTPTTADPISITTVTNTSSARNASEYTSVQPVPRTPVSNVSSSTAVPASTTNASSVPSTPSSTTVSSRESAENETSAPPLLSQDRARNSSERFSSTTTLTVDVKDEDDLEPSFIYQGCTVLHGACVNPEYRATVSSGVLSGVLAVRPDRIQAVDMDSLAAPVRYSFLSGTPASYADYFTIDATSGAVRQVRAVDTAVAKSFDIIVKAEEDTPARRFTTAKLVIMVKPVDTSPPAINASSLEGFVDENAPKGTRVLDASGRPLTLTVTDADLGPDDPKPGYIFELTTPYFAADEDGVLVVNEEKLDRDPPSPGKFRFQVVARERVGAVPGAGAGAPAAAASAPLSLQVTLRDVNDNAPQLPHLPTVTVPAGEGRRHVVRLEVKAYDLGEPRLSSQVQVSVYVRHQTTPAPGQKGIGFADDTYTAEIPSLEV